MRSQIVKQTGADHCERVADRTLLLQPACMHAPSRFSLLLVALLLCVSWSTAEAKPKKKRRGKRGGKSKPRKKPPKPAPKPDPVEGVSDFGSEDDGKPRGRDKIVARAPVAVHEGPGDGFKSKRKLKPGSKVTVLGRSGRWARVRAGKTRGWVLERALKSYAPREGQAEVTEETPSNRIWGKGEDNSGRFFVVEIASQGGELRASSNLEGESIAKLSPGDRVVVLTQSADREWMQVRENGGKQGWIQRASVKSSVAGGFGADAGKIDVSEDLDPVREREAMPRVSIRSRLGIGYRSLSMDFSSAGAGRLANTIVETQAMAASGASELVLRRANRRMYMAVDGRLRLSYSNPGIEIRRAGNVLGDVEFSMLEWQAGVRGGMALGRDFEIALRGGLRYDVFYTSSVDNPGLLPRESLLAYTAGSRLDWYRFLPDLVVSAYFEALLTGKRKQTPGLQDGTDATLRGAWVGLQSDYRLGPQLDLFASFIYGWVRTEWSGTSERNPDVMQSSRTDSTQTIQFGVARRF